MSDSSKTMFSPSRDRLDIIINTICLQDSTILQGMCVDMVRLNSWSELFDFILDKGGLYVKVKIVYGRAYPKTDESNPS